MAKSKPINDYMYLLLLLLRLERGLLLLLLRGGFLHSGLKGRSSSLLLLRRLERGSEALLLAILRLLLLYLQR